ncbi:uncharacterized protein LOC133306574 [Gastrolobium bilobum]|uniref:uncharacterized protein LOC133306574 n=1 Tax=Gastrolobium bilobum TaxID=150636 RepID=UPI002AB15694|nr:uncharacterized protein LOC133306574 [Gastrolobium bilobum]
MAPYEALYGRKCRSPLCWTEVGERSILGPDVIQETYEQVKKIRENMQRAQARQKNYYDKRHKPLSFEVGDHVFLRITPTSGLGRRMRVKKLSPRYLGPYLILDRIGESAYRLALPPNLSGIHDIMERSVKQLRSKEVPLVKVLWNNKSAAEATWEREDEIRKRYPELFNE